MGWMNRYGNPHHPNNRFAHEPLRAHHVIIALFYLAIIIAALGSFPLMIFFIPTPERGTHFPPRIFCATCKEIAMHNPLLLKYGNKGVWMGCQGPLTEVYKVFCSWVWTGHILTVIV